MTSRYRGTDPLIKQNATPKQEAYNRYTIRIQKGSLAAQGLPKHMQRFNIRYPAGWLATLVEEFYVLLDGPDPRSSLLFPLIYQRFESTTVSSDLSAHLSTIKVGEKEQEADIDLAELQDMSNNLQGYFDEI